jgi:hypothetical protein
MFDHGPVRVTLVVDKVISGQGFSPSTFGFPVPVSVH